MKNLNQEKPFGRDCLIRFSARLCVMVSCVCLFSGKVDSAENPFAAGVRPTEPLTPEKEQTSFQLPRGFEIELVVSEPEIAKPMNMAFDVKGRLWVTDTLEYPFPAPLDKPGRDSIKVLSDNRRRWEL